MDKQLDDLKWKAIFNGEHSYKFDNFGFSMMVGRLSRKFKKDPTALGSCIEEANSFCNRYASILGNDLKKLNNA